MKRCLREPIHEIFDASRYLDAAASAHLTGNIKLAEELIREADMPEIREWTESLWGANSEYINHIEIPNSPPSLPKSERVPVRMPNREEKKIIHERDGYHCRFCGIPVIRKEIRVKLNKLYPNALPWGKRNPEQHSAFQAMWLQYDHLIPHARGGNNDIQNIIITCAPCNYGRLDSLIEEVGIQNPFVNSPIDSLWDGLERIITKKYT